MTPLRAALLAAVVCALGFSSASVGQEASAPLEIDDVLASSERHFPRILRSIAAAQSAAGDVLSSAGAFDLVFSADSFGWLDGFYDGVAVDSLVRQPLRTLGASVYAGYKLSDGTLPIYEDEYFTNSSGSVKVGVLFSLMRDRGIDPGRFGEADARIALRQAELDILLTKIGVQQRALIAYWRWAAAGRQLRVYENLLRLAVERQQGLNEQVRRGARAQIFLTENLQNITRRQTFVTRAQRDVQRAANELSLYYRDEAGDPLQTTIDRLPPGAEINDIYALANVETVPLAETLARRPELAMLRATIEREQNRLALAQNDLKPRLDFNLEVQSGLGNIAEGGASRDTTDTVVGLTFSVPLQRSEARGRIDRSRANLNARRFEQQLREEEIGIEVRNLLLELNVASELLLLAAQDVQQSEIVAASEVRRFQSGASDFFLLNIREERAADARVRLVQAEFNSRVARANYDAATVNVEGLGIDSGSIAR